MTTCMGKIFSGLCALECGFTLKHVHNIIRTYSQIHQIKSAHNTAQSFDEFG